MTKKEYLADGALAGSMEIVAIIDSDRPIIRTKTTWFHPQGGGQKADRGVLGGVEVYNVRHGENGEVDHYVSSVTGLKEGEIYEFSIDPLWRNTNSIYHSAGHLLATVCEDMFPGVSAVAGHQWPGEARVDFSGNDLSRVAEAIKEIESRLHKEIQEDLPVQIVGDPFESRMIQMGKYAPIPCGGTHVAHIGEFGKVQIRSTKIRDGVLRLGYEAFPT